MRRYASAVDLGPVLLLIAPVVGGGIAQAVVIRWDLFPRFAAIPLDFGATIGGRRLFGANKTLRGALVMMIATGMCSLALFSAVSPYEPPPAFGWFGLGVVMGFGYIAAELPNSFVKRRLGIPPGASGGGRVQYAIDQCDSVIGVVLALWVVTELPPADLATVGVLGVVVHVLFDLGMHRAGVKSDTFTPRARRGPRG
jgi:hypothetical protein